MATGADSRLLLPETQVERALSNLLTRAVLAVEPARLVPAQLRDLIGIELLVAEAPEFVPSSFALAGRSDATSTADFQRSLRSAVFSGELDRLRETVRQDLQLDKSITLSVAGVSLGVSLLYVLWLIRGGVLMGSYLSALPAWRILDPLPVLSRVDEDFEEDDEALDAVADGGGNPLRGFG